MSFASDTFEQVNPFSTPYLSPVGLGEGAAPAPPLHVPAKQKTGELKAMIDLFGHLGDAVNPAVILARMELADRFEVLPAGFTGPKSKPNQVTEAEMDHIVEVYGKIKYDDADLKINTDGLNKADAAKFKDGALSDIADIMQTEAGRELISKLADNDGGNDFDASGKKIHHTTTLYAPKNSVKDYDPDEPHSNVLKHKKGQAIDGTGTDSMVFVQPGHSVKDPHAEHAWAKDARSDVILFHELVHALHHTAGTKQMFSAGGLGVAEPGDEKYSAEDYQTVGLGGMTTEINGKTVTENEYRKERLAIGTGGSGIGVKAGDATMEQRLQYHDVDWHFPGFHPTGPF